MGIALMEENLQHLIHDLLQTQSLGVLATSSDGHPYTTLVGFAAGDSLAEIYFATHRSTRKFANLSHDQRITLLIDNRSNQPDDFRHAAALTAFGTANEVPAEKQAALQQLFLEKHPMLKEFVLSPGCALCRIAVQRYSLVQRFQNVVELVLDDTDPAS